MKENKIELVLKNGRSIGQQMRNPGFVLLEGIAPENVTSFDIEKAVTNKDVQARPGKAAAPVVDVAPAIVENIPPVETTKEIVEPEPTPAPAPIPEPKPEPKPKTPAKPKAKNKPAAKKKAAAKPKKKLAAKNTRRKKKR